MMNIFGFIILLSLNLFEAFHKKKISNLKYTIIDQWKRRQDLKTDPHIHTWAVWQIGEVTLQIGGEKIN